MNSPKQYVGRKAVKATVRHSVRGTAKKARREPPRAVSLIGLGIVLGAVASWILARNRSSSGDPFPAYEAPTPAATHSTPEAKAAAAA
jgi:hypothetical protein